MNIRKKYVDYLIALMIIVSLNFMLPRLMPGDPLEAIYGGEALLTMTTEVKAELAERFGLDKSLPEQFATYLLAMATGNLGYSYYYHTQVSELVFGALPWTILLVGLALVISTVIGFALGLEAGWSHNKAKGKGILTGLMFLNGFPDFFIAILLLSRYCFARFDFSGLSPGAGANRLSYSLSRSSFCLSITYVSFSHNSLISCSSDRSCMVSISWKIDGKENFICLSPNWTVMIFSDWETMCPAPRLL